MGIKHSTAPRAKPDRPYLALTAHTREIVLVNREGKVIEVSGLNSPGDIWLETEAAYALIPFAGTVTLEGDI